MIRPFAFLVAMLIHSNLREVTGSPVRSGVVSYEAGTVETKIDQSSRQNDAHSWRDVTVLRVSDIQVIGYWSLAIGFVLGLHFGTANAT